MVQNSGMHIAFIHTPVPLVAAEERRTYWRNFDVRYYGTHPNLRPMKRYLWELPHWITWLGGILEHEGFSSMEAIDLYTDCAVQGGIDEERIWEIVSQHLADVYLFSPMTPNLPHALQIADMIKVLNPESTIVFGGVVAEPLCHEIARHPSVDYVVIRRGEYALPALLRAIENRADVAEVGQLAFKTKEGQVIVNRRIYPDMPLTELPFPRVDLFPRSAGDDIRYIRQVYALGCPYRCSFCSVPMHGCRPSYFSVDRVLSEIRAYRKHYGEHHHIYFGDLTFTLDFERTLKICSALRAAGNVYYDCQTRFDCLEDPRLLAALYESGCRWIEIGFETVNDSTRNSIKKTAGNISVLDRLKRLRDNGLAACAYMIVGLPEESIDDMNRSVEWICELVERGLLHASYLFNLVPFPGSAIFEHPEAFGVNLRHRRFELYREDLLPVYDSSFATAEQIHTVLIEGVRAIGKAMSQKPYLGENYRCVENDSLGAFWKEGF